MTTIPHSKPFESLAKQISQRLPPFLQDVTGEFESTIQTILQDVFRQVDLVTREEFNVQAAVLLKTQKRIAALEAHLSQLETQLDNEKKRQKIKYNLLMLIFVPL